MPYRHPITGCRADQLFWPNIWLVDATAFQDAVAVCRSIPLTDIKVMADKEQEKEAEENGGKKPTYFRNEGPVGVIPISGIITKHPSSFSPVIGGGSTLRAIQGIRNAAADPTVDRILLHIDNSPGGLAIGVPELVDEIKRIDSKVKPVYVHADDGMMSAAYWIGSAGRRITMNKVGMAGSIGTMAVLYDRAQEYKQEGVKVLVIKAGEHKGIGVPGTEISEEQQRVIQERVDDVNKLFTTGVRENRKLNDQQMAAITDARVHLAERAKDLKLIDEIGSYEEVLADLSQKSVTRPAMRGTGGGTIPVAAHERSTTVYNAEQMQRLRKLPGAETVTEEQSEAKALELAEAAHARAQTLETQLTEAKANQPKGATLLLADATVASGHARLATKEIDLLQRGEQILPEQATILKDVLQPGKPQGSQYSTDGTVYVPLEKVVAALELNKPAGLLKEISHSQPAPRQEPGTKVNTVADAANATATKTINKYYPPAQAKA